jgi:N-acetylglucosaminyldiphosphoundecaprenol N-acetyl-beta-D-mannosaminyltransferase
MAAPDCARYFLGDRSRRARFAVRNANALSIDELAAPAIGDRLDVPIETIGDLPIAVIDRARSARLMIELAAARRHSGKPPYVLTSANGQVLSMCAHDPQVRQLFLAADLIHADGTPLVFASRWLAGQPLPERVATTDLFHDVAGLAAASGATFYLLGATDAVIGAAARRAALLHPRLQICGHHSGYFNHDQEAEVVADINRARPDILWIGMGAPRELAFALRNRRRLDRVGVIKTSGGLFDFLSGQVQRAPDWIQSAGLEWAFRTFLEPRRLAHRYLTTNPHALYLLLTRTKTPAL